MKRQAFGYEKVAIGSVTPRPNHGNIAIGYLAGSHQNISLNNVAIGYLAGSHQNISLNNVAIGYHGLAGYSATGDPLIAPSNSGSFTGPQLASLPMYVHPSAPPPPVRKPRIEDKPASSPETQCAICIENAKRVVFQCGHMTCHSCSEKIQTCAHCRAPITLRIPVFD
jgi:hypothetical protein